MYVEVGVYVSVYVSVYALVNESVIVPVNVGRGSDVVDVTLAESVGSTVGVAVMLVAVAVALAWR